MCTCCRYVQLCRSLKTYGITCFNVKEKKKKKLCPILLGVTRHAILRMDAETKEVMKEFPLPHLKQWSASPTAFTMDFGDYEESYYSVLTNEADAISQLIAGYIDIILKTRRDAARVIEEEEPELLFSPHANTSV
jgi:talin